MLKRYDIDGIYHTAAMLTLGCDASPSAGFKVNVGGTLNLLEAARIMGVSDVAYISSGATYGIRPPKNIYNDTPQNAEHMYATTKICSEQVGAQYHRQFGVNFRGIRVAMVVGPTRQISYYYGDWSGVIETTASGKPYTVHSNLDVPAAYIYVKDLALALIGLHEGPGGEPPPEGLQCAWLLWPIWGR